MYTCVADEMRTDSNYKAGIENNQKDSSPLLEIPNFGMASCFPIDYQHVVCLGVVRKLFHLYFTKKSIISKQQVSLLSDFVSDHSSFTPREFQRRPRRIDRDLAFFKASEYKLFLLYVGPFFFKKFLPSVYYNHFILLHFSIYVFCSPRLSHFHSGADSALQLFVSQIDSL